MPWNKRGIYMFSTWAFGPSKVERKFWRCYHCICQTHLYNAGLLYKNAVIIGYCSKCFCNRLLQEATLLLHDFCQSVTSRPQLNVQYNHSAIHYFEFMAVCGLSLVNTFLYDVWRCPIIQKEISAEISFRVHIIMTYKWRGTCTVRLWRCLVAHYLVWTVIRPKSIQSIRRKSSGRKFVKDQLMQITIKCF